MKTTTLRILTIVVAGMLVLAMAGCKSESSPTAPPTTSTSPPSGGVTPPTGATIVLTVSPSNSVLVNSTITVTATVTENGTPVTDGTAVQFTTTAGTFADTGTNTTIRTTTAGVATAKLSSSSAGSATITATVNNVSKTTAVTFTTVPPTPVPPSTAPTITSVCVQTGSTCTSPATGIPGGGQQVIISGTNFRQPVRVLFDPGNGVPAKEAFVSSVTPTQIVAVAPPFDVTTGQTLPVNIIVIDEAGTTNEQRATAQSAFTYQLAVLTPSVRTVTPTSGPIDGGTRVSILGDGFQSPVQVFFGSAEAQQIKVTFNEIVVMSPTARDTSPDGSGTVTGPVDVKVRNAASGKEVTFPAGFRYIAKMQITAAGPTFGPTSGGTRVTIDGVGFNDPIAVVIGGVAAQPIKVTGTEIIAITSAPLLTACSNVVGPISVSNVDNGDTALGPQFTFVILKPLIVGVGTGTLGGTTTVQVANASGTPRITIGTGSAAVVAFITGVSVNATTGITTFTVQIPPSLTLGTVSCSTGGPTALIPTSFDVTYTSLESSCSDTAAKALTVNPPPGAVLTVIGAFTPFIGKITPGQVGPPATPTTVTVTPASETVAFFNTGNTTTVTISSVGTANAGGVNGCSAFNINETPPPPVSLNQCESMAIGVSYKGQTTPTTSPDQCTITVNGLVGTTPFTRTFTVSGSSQ
jgi:large repetitive protein